MAGGKLSARQKMINLMYLVFIAMMALNMSKEVLSAFGLMNEKLEKSNVRASERNEAFMEDLQAKVEEQPEKYKPELEKTKRIAKLSDDLIKYLEETKDVILAGMTDEQKVDYQTMDKSAPLDEHFFAGGQITSEGKEFVEKIDAYRNGINAELKGGTTDFTEIIKSVNADFSTEPVENRDGLKVDWLRYNYEGFPMVASLTKLTQMENDVKKDESEILSAILGGKLKSEVSLSNFEAIVVADKTAYFSGEKFTGKIVLGKKDKTLKAHKVTVNGKELSPESMQEGQTILEFPAGNVGEQTIEGEFQFKEGDSIIPIPIKSSYSVIPLPNSAVISADKMNVVYRGVTNPMTISIPGVASVSAKAPGLKSGKGAGKYSMNVTNVKKREVKIVVSGKLPNGKVVSDSKTFRIKDIPRPVGTVRGEDGSIKMTKSSLAVSTIGAILPDFDFNLKLKVTGFKIKVPGQPTSRVSGNKLNSAARAALKRAKRGESVQIFDINAKLASGSSYRVKKVSPVIVELTN
ncbi:gliding motility protein GldM [Aquimarina agarivorans]|uniref:type IX secretion system motor protein PorM/GldM n=1 Tax=Aquimarina agarivorans TaxID=980584 RepID=UPI000248FD4A|nr:gliding motility protein GldM [Aquimarina agarivorans]